MPLRLRGFCACGTRTDRIVRGAIKIRFRWSVVVNSEYILERPGAYTFVHLLKLGFHHLFKATKGSIYGPSGKLEQTKREESRIVNLANYMNRSCGNLAVHSIYGNIQALKKHNDSNKLLPCRDFQSATANSKPTDAPSTQTPKPGEIIARSTCRP